MTQTDSSTDNTELAERQFNRWLAERLWDDAPEDAKERIREAREEQQ